MDDEALLVEYKALRDEAMVTYNRRAAVQNVGTALFAGLQVAAFMQKVPELSIGANILILAFYRDDIRWIEAGAKIGAYIRNIIEPRVPDLQWETILGNTFDPQRRTLTIDSRLAKLLSRYPMTAIVGFGLSFVALGCSGIAGTLRICVDVAIILITMLCGVLVFLFGTDCGELHRRWNERFAAVRMELNKPGQ